MADERKDLPPVGSANYLEKLREFASTYLGNRGDKLDRGVTLRDLTEAGLVTLRAGFLKNGGSPIGGTGWAVGTGGAAVYVPDLTPPPTPTGFTATAAISHLIVGCDDQSYSQGHGHAKSVLYGATWVSGPLPVFANAVVLTEFQGTVASHATNPATTWHLWLKWVTVDGIASFTAAGGTNGVVTRTGEDVALLLEALTGELTESQLYAALGTRIDLIDTPITGLVAEVAAAKLRIDAVDTPTTGLIDKLTVTNANVTTAAGKAQSALDSIVTINSALADLQGTSDYNPVTTYVADNKVKYSGGLYQAIGTTTGNLPTNTSYWTQIGSYVDTTALAATVGGHTTDISTINGNVTALTTTSDALVATVAAATSAISQEQSTRADQDTTTATRVTAMSSSLDASTAGLMVEQVTRASDTAALATQTSTLVASTGQGIAGLTVEQNARATDTSALAGQMTSLVAVANGGSAGLIVEQTARADATGTLASQLTTLVASAAGGSAAITQAQSASVNADMALATQVSTLIAATGNNVAGIVASQTVATNANAALAAQVTTLSSTVDGNTAAIQTTSTALATKTGELYAQYTVKVDVAGYVAGFGLASTLINDTPTSEFIIRADKFAIAPVATDNTATDGSPFFYRTVATIINGVSVPPGAYMKAAYIHDASISNAKIQDLAVDDAKIVSLDVVKLNAGSLKVGSYIQSTGYTAGPSGAGYRIDRDQVWLPATSIRGQLSAAQVNTDGLTIWNADHTKIILASGTALENQFTAGSGNLYRNTDFNQDSGGVPTYFAHYNNGGYGANHSVARGGAVGSANYWRMRPTANVANTWGFLLGGGWQGWQANVDYVWSFYARAPEGGNILGATFYPAWNHAPASQSFLQNPPLTTSWQRYVSVLNFGNSALDANGFFSINIGPNAGVPLDFSCIQVETGTAPSGWAATLYIDGYGYLQGFPSSGVGGGSGVSVLNSGISISSDGTLNGGGGGGVTIDGLGYYGAMNANYTTNTNQLTDGAGLGTTAYWSNIVGQANAPANNANYTTNTNQLTDGSNLGGTANWSTVYNNDGNRPANGATVGATFGDYYGNYRNIGGAITAGNISSYVAGAAIGYAQIGSVDAGTISVGYMSGDRISGRTISAGHLAAYTITAYELSAGQLISYSAQIGDGLITNAKIGDLQVNTAKLAGNSVTVSNSGSGSGYAATNITCPPYQTIRLMAIGGSAGHTQYGWPANTETTTLTLYGQAVSSSAIGAAFQDDWGTRMVSYAGATLVKGVEISTGGSALNVTASVSGGAGCSIVLLGMIK